MTPDEFQKRLGVLKEELAIIVVNAPIVEAQELSGRIIQRVFVTGKDSNNNDIGQYAGSDSKSKGRYKAMRNEEGFRIDKVDLQFKGNLLGSLKSGVVDDGAVVGFNNLEQAKIANYNKDRYKKPIFAPTTQEQEQSRELMKQYAVDELQQKIRNIFNG